VNPPRNENVARKTIMAMIARLLLPVNVAAALESGTVEGVGHLAQFYWSRENEDDDDNDDYDYDYDYD